MHPIIGNWENPATRACAFGLAGRAVVRLAQEQVRCTQHEADINNAKVLIEEAVVVAAAELEPYGLFRAVEAAMSTPDGLPPELPVPERARELLDGSDPVCAAYARIDLADFAYREAKQNVWTRRYENAYAEGREDEIEPLDLGAHRLWLDAKVSLGRILDHAVLAEVVDISARFSTAREQRGLLRLVA